MDFESFDINKSVPTSSVQARKVVGEKPFKLAIVGLGSPNILAMMQGLCSCGASVLYVSDNSQNRINEFLKAYPSCKAISPEDILLDENVHMVLIGLRPDLRSSYSIRCIQAGKAVFCDSPGFLELDESEKLKQAIMRYNGKYFIYFKEHFHCESSIKAQQILEERKIGRIQNYIGIENLILDTKSKEDWFYLPSINGDIIVNQGCNLIEQFLLFTDNINAKILSCTRKNLFHQNHPLFYDCAEIALQGDNGATGYIRTAWNPLQEERISIVNGDKGYIEIRKALGNESDLIFEAEANKSDLIDCRNAVGFNLFSNLILDCIDKNAKCNLRTNGISLPLFFIKAMETAISVSRASEFTQINL